MKYVIYFGIIFLLFGCSNTIKKETLTNLNGYWEITEVEFTDGQKKTYTVNSSIDYIKLTKMKGIKKKMQPKLNGSYITTNDVENFTINQIDGIFYFQYENDLSQWQEKLITLEENTFSVKNQDNITYTYKRFEPIKIE